MLEPAAPEALPPKPSFLGRIFARRKAASPPAPDERPLPAEALEVLAALEAAEPIADIPTLSEKLARIAESESPAEAEEAEPEEVEPAEQEAQVNGAEADEPGPLTLSLMDLQAKIKEKPSQIRAFPWLRG
jgi:hypothetical protein